MANIESSQHLKLDVASLMADIATVFETVTLLSLESLDDFQKVSVKSKVVKLKDQVEVGGRTNRNTTWSRATTRDDHTHMRYTPKHSGKVGN